MSNKFILLEGMPGCGKTTIVKKIVSNLKKNGNANIKGFYTEEVRNNDGERIGFDVHLLDNAKSVGILARVGSSAPQYSPIVGKYKVYINDFEQLIFPYMNSYENENGSYLIIDEIGRMEFFSKKFKDFIIKLRTSKNELKILATVPLKSSDPLITQLKENSQLFHITKSNRDKIIDDVYTAIIDSKNQH